MILDGNQRGGGYELQPSLPVLFTCRETSWAPPRSIGFRQLRILKMRKLVLQEGDDLVGRREANLFIFGQQTHHEVFQPGWHIGVLLADRARLIVDDSLHDCEQGVAAKRRMPNAERVHHAPQAE